MALVDLKSNLANFRSNFVTPGVEKKNAPEASKLNIDKIPTAYSGKTKFTVQYVDRNSVFNKDGFNIKFSPSGVYLPNNFTVKKINSSKFNIDVIPNKFSPSGVYIPDNFTPTKINSSKFNIDNTPSKFSPSGIYLPELFTTKKINSSKYNIDSTPAKFSPNTKYLPTKYYPEKIIPLTTSRWGRWAGPRPPAVNFFNDKDSNAKGFTIYMGDPGRTPNKISGDQSQFFSFQYDKVIPTQNTNFRSTVASRLYQLGIGLGSPFPKRVYYIDGNSKPTNEDYNWVTPTSAFDKGVKTPHTGFHAGNTYVKIGDKFKGFLAATYNTNSPIDELYKKYNLQDEANSDTSTSPYSSYIRQPFIERGIQRKGKESPQRWGIGNFDDGLIRSGITTAIERAAVDTARIAKWMASPRGLLWIVKQIGLGLTNAKVEAPAGRFGRATRIHTGITSLLSVAGTAFGLHFTRHGIPFRNSRADYEEVIRGKTSVFNDLFPEISNRLLTLRTELGLNSAYALDTNVGGTMLTLSGWGGPESVYGIGYTSIKRKVHSRLDRGGNKLTSFYNVRSQYASFESKSRFKSGTGIDINNTNTFQNIDSQSAKNTDERSSLKTRWLDSTGGTTEVEITKKSDFPILDKFGIQFTGDIKVINAPENVYRPDSILKNRDIDTEGNALIVSKSFEPYFSKARTGHAKDPYKYQTNSPGDIKQYDEASNLKKKANKLADPISNVDPGTGGKIIDTASTRQYSNGNISTVRPIDNYLTLAYGKIPAKFSSSFNDFRQAVETQNDIDRGLVGKRTDADYYGSKNLETKYGFGKLGEVGKNLSNPNEFLRSGSFIDKESLKGPANRHALASEQNFRGDKITAINVISDQIPTSDIYPENTSDLIKFYFEDGKEGVNVMPFRCTMVSLTDNFSPGWDKVDIMGRPDGAYIYTSFERSISFNFIVAALSRSEMIPMWRKLNKLATYTMPNFDGKNGRPSGPLMRISIGNLFQRTPGFITSLTYTIPDDATWDIGEDISEANRTPKQLPMMVDASVTYTIVGDFRPQLNGRVYSLQHLGGAARDKGDWIPDAKTTSPPIVAEDPTKTAQADKISADSSAKKSFNDRARAGEPIGPLGLTY